MYDQDCPGSLLNGHSLEANSRQECADLCSGENACLGFTRNEQANDCWLKSVWACGNAVVSTCPDGDCFYGKVVTGNKHSFCFTKVSDICQKLHF